MNRYIIREILTLSVPLKPYSIRRGAGEIQRIATKAQIPRNLLINVTATPFVTNYHRIRFIVTVIRSTIEMALTERAAVRPASHVGAG